MATILSSRPLDQGRAPGSTRLARWLDEFAPLLLLVAVLALVAAAGREAHAAAAAPVPAAAHLLAE